MHAPKEAEPGQNYARLNDKLAKTLQFLWQNKHHEPVRKPHRLQKDFLLQEFLREINTIASKINNTEVTHRTVDLKNEVEKMREQVANIE